ncbi:MAG: hypothetical protein QOK15_1956 [Nocardioidaceae bacterium]|jgi:hypothetical protein|nr:hypothetical protein [Nocardioidaceae bacterium]
MTGLVHLVPAVTAARGASLSRVMVTVQPSGTGNVR